MNAATSDRAGLQLLLAGLLCCALGCSSGGESVDASSSQDASATIPVPREHYILPPFRPDFFAAEDGDAAIRSDPVLGGNGAEWRDLRGASPRDMPGELGLVGSLGGETLCAGAAASSCVPFLPRGTTCVEATRRDQAGQVTAVEAPADWLERLLSCARSSDAPLELPSALSRGIALGAQLVVLQPRRSALSEVDLACAERGLAELARGLWRLGEDIGRELYLQTGLLSADGLPALEVAALPAQLVELPEDLVGNRTHLLAAALRARGRRAVITPAFQTSSNRQDSPALSLADIARHLVWGAALKIDEPPPAGIERDFLDFGRRHKALLGLAEAPLAVVFSLAGWTEMSEGQRRKSALRSDELLEGLARAGIPYEVVVLGRNHRGPDPAESVALALQRFDVLLLPMEKFSAAEDKALIAFAAAKRWRVGFVGPSLTGGSPRPNFERWGSPDDAVRFARGLRLAVESSPSSAAALEGVPPSLPSLRISRHVVARDGGVAFHLIPEGGEPADIALFLPERLLPTTDFQWWFHHLGGSEELAGQRVEGSARTGVELELPPFAHWGILEARPSPGTGGAPDLKIVGSNERTVFMSVWDDPMDEELGLIFPENLSPWPVDHGGFAWTLDPSGRLARFSWPVRPVSVVGSVEVVGDRIALEVTFTNHSDERFSEVYSGLCLGPNSAKGFPGRFHERSWLVGPEGPRSLADLRASSGASPLHVATNQFSWPVAIEESVGRDRSIAIAFDNSSGVGGNAWGASVCLHVQPTLKTLEAGASASLRGAIYFIEGPVEVAVERLRAEGWGSSRQRYGKVPDRESFADGLPPHRPPPCHRNESDQD